METNFDMDNFEHSLKQHADQFSMIPSKRVWNGVYNSLHPGSKWPSFTMLLFFLLTLIGIGPLNHFSKNYPVSTLPDNSQNSINEENDPRVFNINANFKGRNNLSDKLSSGEVISSNFKLGKSSLGNSINIESKLLNSTDEILINTIPADKEEGINNTLPTLSEEFLQVNKIDSTNPDALLINILDYKKDITSKGLSTGILVDETPGNKHSIVLSENIIIDDSRSLASFLKSNPGKSVLIEIEDIDSSDAENEVTEESSTIKTLTKRNRKTTWIFFATPAITTTYFTGKSQENQNPINTSPLIVNPNQIGNTVRFNARIGLNIGAEMNYEFSEGWEIVTGTQLSYSGYNILAHKVHPSFSYLYLKNEANSMEPKKYITFYGSGEGLDEITLHNNSIQLSIPIGIKHSVWKNNTVEIKIGTSLQPSLILNSHAYILSSDGRNYVTDQDLMRQVNVSGELNSSIIFQGEKVKWHIGPTIRYQALSSYKNMYPVSEHLIDYGIRIGISK